VTPTWPQGRDLTQPELRRVATALAGQTDSWAGLVSHDPSQRIYEELLRDDHLAVWLICWMEGHDTGFHDHDGAAGGVAVVRGRLREERLRIGGPPTAAEIGTGQTFGFEATDIHRVVHSGSAPAVSIHAYSPPLLRMGSYEIEPTGALRRHALTYMEELRPLAPDPGLGVVGEPADGVGQIA
jgi:predicted metal-dependent enzyme (double-stranded beta helix superfamily)